MWGGVWRVGCGGRRGHLLRVRIRECGGEVDGCLSSGRLCAAVCTVGGG